VSERKRLTCTTPIAKRLRPLFVALAATVGLDTAGVKVSVSARHRFPHQMGGVVMLPVFDDDFYRDPVFARVFVHELQHACDILDGTADALSRDEMEARANTTAHRLDDRMVEVALNMNGGKCSKEPTR